MARIKYTGKFEQVNLVRVGRGTKLVKKNTPIEVSEEHANQLIKETPENWKIVKDQKEETKTTKEVKK